MTPVATDPELPIDRHRYWRIVRFFATILLHIAILDLLLGRLWFVGHAIRRSRPHRLRQKARHFRDLAVEMGGVLIKLGQFLSARVDVLPVEVTEELQGLQDEVPPVPPLLLREVLEQELGSKIADFAHIELEPLAAASLGQTVRGWLKDEQGGRGAAVVIKVQRPQIEQIVNTDLQALHAVAPWLMRYRPIQRRANVPALLDEFAATLREELDYETELYQANRFRKIFAANPHVYIPHMYEQYSTGRLLVMENVENMKVNEVEKIKAAGINPQIVADTLIEIYLQQIFNEGIFHADPHPGNIFIRPLGPELSAEQVERGYERAFQLIFIDFGMIGRLSPELKTNLSQVLIGLVQHDARSIVQAYERMGFFLPGTDLERIIQAQDILLERLDGRNLRDLANPDPEEVKQIGQEFRDILFEFPFQVPHDFIYLGRALGILSGIAVALHPEINPWYQIEQYGLHLIQYQRPKVEFSREALLQLADNLRPYLGFPAQLQRVVKAAENGRLRLQSQDPQALRKLEQIEKRLAWLNWSILGASALLSGTLLYLNRQNQAKMKDEG